jgi:hypothetical protein
MRGRIGGMSSVLSTFASGAARAMFTLALAWLLVHLLKLVGLPFLADHTTDTITFVVMGLGFIGGVIESRRAK